MRFPRYVYVMQNKKTKRIYIGSTYNVKKRFSEHMNLLKSGKCKIEDMQMDFNEICKDFSVHIVDIIYSNLERNKEYEWMIAFNSNKRGIGYNYDENPKKFCIKKASERHEIQRIETESKKFIRERNWISLRKLSKAQAAL